MATQGRAWFCLTPACCWCTFSRDEMEQSARTPGEGWKASIGTAEDSHAFFGAGLPDVETRE